MWNIETLWHLHRAGMGEIKHRAALALQLSPAAAISTPAVGYNLLRRIEVYVGENYCTFCYTSVARVLLLLN